MHRLKRMLVAAVLLVVVVVPALTAAPQRALTADSFFDIFTDVSTHWAGPFMSQMYDLGALDDTPPLYHPDSAIGRGKMARYLVLGWGLEPYAGTAQFFSDVPPAHQYFKYANSLYIRGIMIGSGGVFGVDDPLTREQAATILVRAAGREEAAQLRPAADAEAICSGYSDHAQISSWAIPYVAEAKVAGLFTGDAAGTFRPLASLSKAEACTVCCRTRRDNALLDFGDAPDWPPLFNFPSTLASDGARHKDYKTVWLGEKVDGEINSRQVNADYFDDGFVRFVAGPTGAAPTMQVEFEVSLWDRTTTVWGQDPAKVIYFNHLIDFNHNMKWDENEWVVRNMVINPNLWPPGVTMQRMLSTPFVATADPYTCWFRMTLTMGQMVTAPWVGKGIYAYGETEDYGPEEQKVLVYYDLLALSREWGASQDPKKAEVAKDLTPIIALVEDLIAEEQRDDPVQVLIQKKQRILDALYAAAEKAATLGLDQKEIDRLFEGIWKMMAFVTEEEVKRHGISLLSDTLRQNFGLPANVSGQIRLILDKLADLLYEQERGDPIQLLLAKKREILDLLNQLIKALDAAKMSGPAVNVRRVRELIALLLLLEQPVPPQPPPPEWPPQTPPKLPGLITGVHSIFEVKDGQALMKIHLLTNYGLEGKVYDIEIYWGHQGGTVGAAAPNFTPPANPTASGGPQGWTGESSNVGLRWSGDTPMVPCTPYYFSFPWPEGVEDITFILTDKEHRPIGHSTSQKVHSGFIQLDPGESVNLHTALDPVGAPPDQYWDIQYVYSAGGEDPTGGQHPPGQEPPPGTFPPGQEPPTAPMGPVLLPNVAYGGGIQLLPHGLADLEAGGYAPKSGYGAAAEGVVVGQYYALLCHEDKGYALLYVVSVGANGCLLDCELDPYSTLEMGLLPHPAE